MEAVIAKKSTLSKLCKPLRLYPQTLVNLAVNDKSAAIADTEVQRTVADAQNKLVGGRVLLRASGTEPLVRLMVESPSEELNELCSNEIIATLRKRGYLSQ